MRTIPGKLGMGAAVLALQVIAPSLAQAELRRVDLKIFGMDCATCAHGVRVAVRKLEGVESVEVSLERASVAINLRPGNRITLSQLRQIIKNNGFAAKEATVTIVGLLTERGGKPALSVTGIDIVWLIAPRAANDAAYADAMQRVKAHETGSVEAVGTVAAPANPDQPEEFTLQSLKAAPK